MGMRGEEMNEGLAFSGGEGCKLNNNLQINLNEANKPLQLIVKRPNRTTSDMSTEDNS